MQHVFLVGAKSLGAYGGYETFINKLTEYHQHDERIKYHVACKANGQGASMPDGVTVRDDGTYTYHNAECFQIKVPEKLGAAQAIYYDCKALDECMKIIKKEKVENAIVYVMACRVGPFFGRYVREIKRLGGRVFLNPDGTCEIIVATEEKPVKSSFYNSLVAHHNSNITCELVSLVIRKNSLCTDSKYLLDSRNSLLVA